MILWNWIGCPLLSAYPPIWIFNNSQVNEMIPSITSLLHFHLHLSWDSRVWMDDGQNLPVMMMIRCCKEDVPPRPLSRIPPSALSRRRCNGCGGETEPDD